MRQPRGAEHGLGEPEARQPRRQGLAASERRAGLAHRRRGLLDAVDGRGDVQFLRLHVVRLDVVDVGGRATDAAAMPAPMMRKSGCCDMRVLAVYGAPYATGRTAGSAAANLVA